MKEIRCVVACALALIAGPAAAEDLRNWFGDPYFQVRSAIAACPAPRGPFETEGEMRQETHYRSERGTRCWLEKKCAKPNSYMYDADIATAVRARFASTRKFKDASLWVTAQRRWLWVEGCVRSARERRELEKFVRGIPDVELVIVNVSDRKGAEPPYRTMR